jgi:hypothetical protein
MTASGAHSPITLIMSNSLPRREKSKIGYMQKRRKKAKRLRSASKYLILLNFIPDLPCRAKVKVKQKKTSQI